MSYAEDVKAYIDGVLSGRIVTGRLSVWPCIVTSMISCVG